MWARGTPVELTGPLYCNRNGTSTVSMKALDQQDRDNERRRQCATKTIHETTVPS